MPNASPLIGPSKPFSLVTVKIVFARPWRNACAAWSHVKAPVAQRVELPAPPLVLLRQHTGHVKYGRLQAQGEVQAKKGMCRVHAAGLGNERAGDGVGIAAAFAGVLAVASVVVYRRHINPIEKK